MGMETHEKSFQEKESNDSEQTENKNIRICSRFLESFRGYRHHGDMRFLTPCKDDFDGLKLLSNPDIFDRARWLVQRLSVNLKFAALDHGIAEYCKKLERYAISRIGPK